jgi:hypothetical protein
MTPPSQPTPVSRVVSPAPGDADGTLRTGAPPMAVQLPGTTFELTDVWTTSSWPPDPTRDADVDDTELQIAPPANGTLFRVIDFPPDAEWRGDAAAQGAVAAVGSGGPEDDGLMWHQTDTIDYIAILSGEITFVSHDGEATIAAGETMVVRGVRHAWSNRAADRCRMACVSLATN